MATAPANNLPLFYKDLVPLSSVDHADFHARPLDSAAFLVDQHAVPLTSDEFVSACRFFPIVFSAGDNPVPLALMGLNEGVNTFVDTEGKLLAESVMSASFRQGRRFQYDAAGRLISVTDDAGGTRRIDWNEMGSPGVVTDALGRFVVAFDHPGGVFPGVLGLGVLTGRPGGDHVPDAVRIERHVQL